MKKEYVLLMMLLVGLLFPMTIASKSLTFEKDSLVYLSERSDRIAIDDLNILRVRQPVKNKSIIRKEVAESSQNIRCAVGKVDIISTFPPSSTAVDTFMEYGLDSQQDNKRIIDGSVGYLSSYQITNYIRYL